MEINPKQQIPSSVNSPSASPEYWTTVRQSIYSWLSEKAPSLAQLYKGAVFLIFEKPIPGRLRFVAHAVREIRNRLPDYFGVQNGETVKYKKELDQLSETWRMSGFSIDGFPSDSNINAETSQPSLSPDIPIPRQLFREFQQLLEKHHAVPIKNTEKALNFFKSCVPANEPLPNTLIPIAKHWWEITEWFMEKTHENCQTDVAERDDLDLCYKFELFESFLETIVKSFYNTTDILDEILKNANSDLVEEANPDLVEKAIPLLIHPQQRSYFFNRLQNPQWIEPLKKKHFFENPPQVIDKSDNGTISLPFWPESRYLARMAVHEPKAVMEIALQIKTDNPRVQEHFVEAALQISPELAVTLTAKVKDWIESPYYSAIFPEKVATFALHLAKGGQVKKAISIFSLLLGFKQNSIAENERTGKERTHRLSSNLQPRLKYWEYERILQEYVPKLVTVDGEKTLKMLCSLLYEAIKFSRPSAEEHNQQEGSPIWEDGSIYWRPAIENHPRNLSTETRRHLVSAIRDAAEQIIKADSAKLPSLVVILEKQHWRVFHRIGLYLIHKFPNSDFNLIAEKLTDHKYFHNSDDQDYEYAILAKEHFAELSPEHQEKILNWIENPEIDLYGPEDLRERASWVRRWQWKKLTPLKDSLPTKWQQQYKQLASEFGNMELDKLLLRGVSEVSVGPLSPKTAFELESMSNEELISFLKNWQPSSSYPFKPSAAGLGSELSKVAERYPERLALIADYFQYLQPEYGCGLLRGLCKALTITRVPGEELKEFSWHSILKLCCWIVHESQQIQERETTDINSYWYEARRAVADCLQVGLEVEGEIGIPIDLRSEVWKSLSPLTLDPDPTLDRERNRISMDLQTLSLNAVRSEAMHAVVRYALWVRRHFQQMANARELIARGFDEIPEVRLLLDTHLDIEQDPSLTIRSVYGQCFPWLLLLDSNWAIENVAKIFPQAETLSELRGAAWEGYITLGPVFDGVFAVLFGEYSHAVEKLNSADSKKEEIADLDKKLAEHLMTLYWRGKLSIEQSDGLLAQFYRQASDALRGYAFNFVGRSLHNTKEEIDPEILKGLQLLWEKRLEIAISSGNPTASATELSAFGEWFASGKFDDIWAIEQLKKVLELVGNVAPDSLVVERLAALAEIKPELTVECLRRILNTEERAWQLYWRLKQVKTILATAIEGNNEEAKRTAEDIIHRLGEFGIGDFRELLSG
ncbi:MAG: hypothetical protein ACM37W_19910 [Actinomycetota bacterium]